MVTAALAEVCALLSACCCSMSCCSSCCGLGEISPCPDVPSCSSYTSWTIHTP